MERKSPTTAGLEVDQRSNNYPEVDPNQPGYNQHYPTSNDISEPHKPSRRAAGPLGLGTCAFGALVALVTAVVVGGAVGGGLGASLKSCKDSQSSSSDSNIRVITTTIIRDVATPSLNQPTSTATLSGAYIPIAPSSVANLAIDCPPSTPSSSSSPSSINSDSLRHVYVSQKLDATYDAWCGVDFPAGDTAANGRPMYDMSWVIVYSLQDCVEACANMNGGHGEDWLCSSFVFNSAMADSVAEHDANCWLKNGTKESKEPDFTTMNLMYGELRR